MRVYQLSLQNNLCLQIKGRLVNCSIDNSEWKIDNNVIINETGKLKPETCNLNLATCNFNSSYSVHVLNIDNNLFHCLVVTAGIIVLAKVASEDQCNRLPE